MKEEVAKIKQTIIYLIQTTPGPDREPATMSDWEDFLGGTLDYASEEEFQKEAEEQLIKDRKEMKEFLNNADIGDYVEAMHEIYKDQKDKMTIQDLKNTIIYAMQH